MIAALTAGFGALALTLTCVGVYGVISFAVERRTREIGIRLALGARRRQVTVMIIRELGLVLAASAILGGAGAVAAARSLRSLLFGIPANDYSMLAWSALLLLTVATAAAYVPARRAARLDPAGALRQE